MRVLGVIIAGGLSRRMGGPEKGFLDLGGQPLLAWAIGRLRPQVAGLVINANGDAARFAGFGLEVVADHPQSNGTPLAGLEAGLAHAASHGFDAIVTVPSDTPFLPADLVVRLALQPPAIARSAGQDHYVTGLWPVALLQPLRGVLAAKSAGRLRDWVDEARAQRVEWAAQPHDPFFNINTPEDLATARRIAGELP